MDVAQHCRKMDVSENGKFIMVDSYEIDFLKSNFTKTRCAIRWSRLATIYLSRDEDEIG